MIKVKNERELRRLIGLFKKYASSDLLDKFGRKILSDEGPIYNSNAIFGAWSVPLLVCSTQHNKKPRNLRDFLAVKQFSIGDLLRDKPVVIKALVRNKDKKLRDVLSKIGIIPQIDKRYILRVFVDDYLDS